jgi:hypothetical protein
MTPVALDPLILDQIRISIDLHDLNLCLLSIADSSTNTRLDLRKYLLKTWALTEDSTQILDLSQPPKLTKGDLSLAHSPPYAAAAITRGPYFIGVDCEPKGRVTNKIMSRISSTTELQATPDPTALWVAKEAAFKGLSKGIGVRLQSDVLIDHWRSVSTGFWSCQASVHAPQAATIGGIVASLTDCYLSIFKTNLNFPTGTPIGT